MTDPDSGVTTYAYDDAMRLESVVNPQGKVTTFSYDLAGRKIQIDHDQGAITTHSYDCADRLTVIEHRKSDDSIVNLTSYTYDTAGNRTGAVEHDGAVTTWTYDGTYQLTGEQRSGTPSFDVSYSYDAVGNRTVQDDSGSLTTYSYDAANRLLTEENGSGVTTYSYDADGNRTEKEEPSSVTYYTWDEDNRLTVAEPVAGPVTFTYRADGRRVEKETPSETVKFIHDGNKLLQETDGSGSVDHQYTFTTEEYGDLVSEYDGADTFTHHHDAIGTADALLDDSEAVAARYEHRAFGVEESHTGTSDTLFTFVGREGYYRDDELDLYLAGARYYDPAAGRWLSEDPIGLEGGDANLYRYVGNNPVNATDPSGLEERLEFGRYHALHFYQDQADSRFSRYGEGELAVVEAVVLQRALSARIDAIANRLSQSKSPFDSSLTRVLQNTSKLLVDLRASFVARGLDRIEVRYQSLNENAFGTLRYSVTGGIDDHDRYVDYFNQRPEDQSIQRLDLDFKVATLAASLYRGFVMAGVRGLAGESVAEATDAVTGYPVSVLAATRKFLKRAPTSGMALNVVEGSQAAPARFVRTVKQGETIADLIAEGKSATWVNEAEHAIVSLAGKGKIQRVVVSGGRDGIEFIERNGKLFFEMDGQLVQVRRVIGHTHPRATGPSQGDLDVLGILGQRRSYIIEIGGEPGGAIIRPK